MKLRLRAIRYGCDFRKNEVTLFGEFRASSRFPGELKSGEAYLFVCASENQLIWFFGTAGIGDGKVTVTDSRRWRMAHGTWSPMMLGEYAAMAGIELLGVRSFAAAFAEQRAAKARAKVVKTALRLIDKTPTLATVFAAQAASGDDMITEAHELPGGNGFKK